MSKEKEKKGIAHIPLIHMKIVSLCSCKHDKRYFDCKSNSTGGSACPHLKRYGNMRPVYDKGFKMVEEGEER